MTLFPYTTLFRSPGVFPPGRIDGRELIDDGVPHEMNDHQHR